MRGSARAGCQWSGARGQEAAQKEFAALRTEWARNLHDKNVDACIGHYAPDAEFINPDGGRVVGAAALRKFYETITSTFDSDLHFDSVRVEISGNMAFDTGTYGETLALRATQKTQLASGSYLTVYQRGKDGHWLIAEQVWTGAIHDAQEPNHGINK